MSHTRGQPDTGTGPGTSTGAGAGALRRRRAIMLQTVPVGTYRNYSTIVGQAMCSTADATLGLISDGAKHRWPAARGGVGHKH